jgi:hypothetical protein
MMLAAKEFSKVFEKKISNCYKIRYLLLINFYYYSFEYRIFV